MNETLKQKTSQQFDEVIDACRGIFEPKLRDYGASWRILRKESILDQIYIKLKRIRGIQDGSDQRVNSIGDDIVSEFKGVFNYSIIALIQNHLGPEISPKESPEEILALYDEQVSIIKELMEKKNHDYGEAWREMNQKSFVDLSLTKLFRIAQIYNNDNVVNASEPAIENYKDICNYTLFALIQIQERQL